MSVPLCVSYSSMTNAVVLYVARRRSLIELDTHVDVAIGAARIGDLREFKRIAAEVIAGAGELANGGQIVRVAYRGNRYASDRRRCRVVLAIRI